jgi:hypothetical protein
VRSPGTARALRARFAAHPDEWVLLGFDTDLRLVLAEAELSMPGFGPGLLEARLSDYREVGGRWLPFDIRYRFRGAPLLDERVVEWRPGDALAGP